MEQVLPSLNLCDGSHNFPTTRHADNYSMMVNQTNTGLINLVLSIQKSAK